MSIRISRSLRCLGAVLASSVWLGGHLSLTAGEPILFIPAKSKLEPGPGTPNNKLPKEKVSALDSIPVANPVDPANLARPTGDDPRRPKTREEKLRKLAELEKKNWATVGAGELQEEEEEKTSMGVREYDVETGGREKNASDILFDRKTGDKSRSQSNLRNRSTASRGPAQNRPPPARESADTRLKIGKAADQAGGTSVSDSGSEDGRLNRLLAPDAVAGPKDNFGGANSSIDQGRRGDSRLRAIESAGTRPATRSGGDALGLGRDTSTRSSLSGPSLLFDAPRSQASSPFASPGGSPGFGSSRNRDVPSPFDPPLASRDRFGNSASTLTPQQNQFAPGSSRDAFAPPTRPSSGR